ncbi:MAG: peptidase C26 [Rheinheimera sp.]|uniref:gamma-glutamyl-gamma-aminobutyrate hydrolase family protein n=1 Tax=Arsukibacterium sp. UBA3155 TaxID=1946058 RepID=UPI000C8ACE3D|nr:gamma-glutamyl-gamma-aminobutyrate hydrolase family protein [Arsukibacterium sp. UBA3155]MAD73967.1 peptidase C26 [Rheinheimera sp.]|tara:strand:- start:22272 stop:22961 length:690 start_codon:yes stop_codon:yes gene_type:complete
MAKPVIAITGPERGAFGPRTLVAIAVRWYGGVPLQLKPSSKLSAKRFDGVVITGGHDVDPVLYAAEAEVQPKYDQARDELEMAVIKKAEAEQLPMLGICRGAQLLNVSRGGSLFQQLTKQRQHTSMRWTVLPLKTLCLEQTDSALQKIFQCRKARINSLHNQAIDKLGKGLKIVGRDLDNIVQAVEDPSRQFVMGVQWHPEFLIFIRRQRHLFKAVVSEARRRLADTAS